MKAVEVKNLVKTFGEIKAVDDVSFDVPEGSIFGIIGRNGAGKTTTIRMLMNIYLPDSGDIFVRGKKLTSEFKERVGYLPEERGLYKKMKVLDTLLFLAEIKGKKGREIEKKAFDYLKRFELYDRRFSKVEDLSKGNQQKIQIIGTLLHDPDFVILDEPFAGLDPVNTNILTSLIKEEKEKGKIIILSTHLMDYAEKLCDYFVMINKGNVLLDGKLSSIKQNFGRRNISLTYEGNIDSVNSLEYVEKVSTFGSYTGITLKDPSNSQLLLKHLVDNNVTVKKFDAEDISLHEIFLQVAESNDNGREV